MPTSLQVATAFVASINARDLDGIARSVTHHSTFFVDGEPPTIGRENLREAWASYFDAFPNYVVFVDEQHEESDATYLVGHTSGSQVPENLEQIPSSVIWRCEVVDGQVAEWSIYPASESNRTRFGLAPHGRRGPT